MFWAGGVPRGYMGFLVRDYNPLQDLKAQRQIGPQTPESSIFPSVVRHPLSIESSDTLNLKKRIIWLSKREGYEMQNQNLDMASESSFYENFQICFEMSDSEPKNSAYI